MCKPVCKICSRRIISENCRVQCDICDDYAHRKCVCITDVDNSQMSAWTCVSCLSDLFPLVHIDDSDLHSYLNDDVALLCELNYDDMENYEFAHKIFDPFQIQDFESFHPNFDIDPDNNYYNGHNLHSLQNCRYFDEDSFNKYVRYKGLSDKGFSIFHHNIRSLVANGTQLEIFFNDLQHKLSVIGLTETWLRPDNVNLYNYQGYQSFHKNREDKKGGGISLFIKDKITCIERNDLTTDFESFESLFIELNHLTTGHAKNVVIGVIYRPPNHDISEFIDHMSSITDTLTRENKNCYLMGDFNLDLFKHETHTLTGDFLNTLLSNSFLPLINRPARVTSSTSTLIDNIFTNNYHRMETPEQGLFLSNLSDHYPIFHMDSIKTPSYENSQRIKRLVNDKTINNFIDAIKKEEWGTIFQSQDPQEAYTLFSNTLKKQYNMCFPIITITGTYRNRLPWLTDGLRASIKMKNRLYKLSIKKPNSSNISYYKTYRNKLNHILKIAEKVHFQQLFEYHKNDMNKTWTLIKNIVWKNKTNKCCGQFLDGTDVVSDKVKICNMFNDFFTNIGINLAKNIPNATHDPSYYLPGSFVDSMSLSPVTENEVSSLIKNLKNIAAGWDDLATKQMKIVSQYISRPLTYLCNLSMTKGVFPRELKVANVIPLFKAGNIMSVNNYRPVSISPVFSKIFEKLMFNRLSEYLKWKNVLCVNQFGFREKHSSYMALITLVDHLSEALEKGDTVIGLFLDFSKAFDTVDHDILLLKLNHYGIRGPILDWFNDYLCNRRQYVTYNGVSSQSSWVKCGVPQGSILGPLLFLIYINDLPNVISLFSVLYADDTNMFDSGKDLDKLIDNINSELNNICDWLNANKLSLNVSKTHFMIWAPRATIMNSLKPIVISGHEIDKVCNTKFLGIVLDDHLNWESHIQYIKNKISKTIGTLKKLRPYINISTMVSLYYSFIYPYLMYCVHVWGKTYASNLDCLNKLQKRIARLIAGVPPREHTAPLFMKYGTLQMSQIADYNIGIFMYKIYYKEVPAIFDSYFTLNCDIHDYNTRQRCCIHVD